jgi:hypothetical protein
MKQREVIHAGFCGLRVSYRRTEPETCQRVLKNIVPIDAKRVIGTESVFRQGRSPVDQDRIGFRSCIHNRLPGVVFYPRSIPDNALALTADTQ